MASGTSVVGLPRILAPAINFTLSNPVLALGQEGVEEDTNNIKVGDGITAWSLLPYFHGLGPSYARVTASHTTAVLTGGSTEQATIALARSYRLLSILTTSVCRVRLYDRAAKQTADLSRAIGSPPMGDHGLTYEFVGTVTPSLLGMDSSPQAVGSSMETSPSTSIPITVDNLSGSSVAITVTFVYMAME
jgi:hypothetical protein